MNHASWRRNPRRDERTIGQRRPPRPASCPHFYPYVRTSRQTGEGPLVDLEVTLTEEDEPYKTHPFEPLRFLSHRPERHLRCFLDRVAEDPGRDGGEGDGLYPVLLGECE